MTQFSITSILLSHFLLDLRSFSQSDSNSFSSDHQGSSVHFAGSILGSMGSTVDAPWAVEEDEDVERNIEENQSIISSNNSLATGLPETVTRQINKLENAEAG